MSEQWKSLKEAARSEAKALDGIITAWLREREGAGRRTFCTAGCSNCCTLFVQATLVEALIVADGLTPPQLHRLKEYVLLQQQVLTGASDFLTILRRQRREIGPCPFLDDSGCCSIYAQRPLACRALLSTKPAEWCSVDFATLDPLEKRLYQESLEREVVSFPVHYVACTQDAAQAAEERLLAAMEAQIGAAISGNLPLLVYLARTLAASSQNGVVDWPQQLSSSPFFHPLLIHMRANAVDKSLIMINCKD